MLRGVVKPKLPTVAQQPKRLPGKGASGAPARRGFGAVVKGERPKKPCGVGTKKWPDELSKFGTMLQERPDQMKALTVAIFHHKDKKVVQWAVEIAREQAKNPSRKRADGESAWLVALQDAGFAAAVRPALDNLHAFARERGWFKEDGSGNTYYASKANLCRTTARVMDAFLMLNGMLDMACLFGLEAAIIGVTGTPCTGGKANTTHLPHGTVDEKANLSAQLNAQKLSVSGIFCREREEPGVIFPHGGVLLSLSLARGGAKTQKFSVFQYTSSSSHTSDFLNAGQLSRLLTNAVMASAAGISEEIARHTVRNFFWASRTPSHGALLPHNGSGVHSSASPPPSSPPNLPLPTPTLQGMFCTLFTRRSRLPTGHQQRGWRGWRNRRGSAPCNARAATHRPTGSPPPQCRRDFETDWERITEDPTHVRDMVESRTLRVRQGGLGGLKGLPWATIAEGKVAERMRLHGDRGRPPAKVLKMFATM